MPKLLKYILIFCLALCLGLVAVSPAFAGAEQDYQKAKDAYKRFENEKRLHKYRDKWMDRIGRFERIVEKYGKHRRVCDSLYNIGNLYNGLSRVSFLKKDRLAGAEAFEKLAGRCPDSSLADDALFLAAELFVAIGDIPRARHNLRKSLDRYPKGDMREKTRALYEELGGNGADRDVTVGNAGADGTQVQKIGAVLRPSEGPAKLLSAEMESRKGETALKMTFTRLSSMSTGEIPATEDKNRRLYFDFSGTELALSGPSEFAPGDVRVRSIRIGQFQKDIVRVVFELSKTAGNFRFSNQLDPPGTELVILNRSGYTGPDRVVAGTAVSTETPTRTAASSKPAEKAQNSAPNTAPAPETSPKEAQGKTQEAENREERAVVAEVMADEKHEESRPDPPPDTAPEPARTVLSPPSKPAPPAVRKENAVRVVVLDPGHGGDDWGAKGPRNVKEKEVVLQIAKRLKKILEKEQKLKVILTRDDDTYLDLFSRTKIANDSNADLFVSIHANAARSRKVYGIETWYLNNSSDSYSRRLAERENKVLGKPISDLEFILTDLSMNANIDDSILLSKLIQKSMIRKLKKHYGEINDRGVHRSVFHVLLHARMPAVLVETAFISNHREEKRLKSASYQERLARGIAEGIRAYTKKLRTAMR